MIFDFDIGRKDVQWPWVSFLLHLKCVDRIGTLPPPPFFFLFLPFFFPFLPLSCFPARGTVLDGIPMPFHRKIDKPRFFSPPFFSSFSPPTMQRPLGVRANFLFSPPSGKPPWRHGLFSPSPLPFFPIETAGVGTKEKKVKTFPTHSFFFRSLPPPFPFPPLLSHVSQRRPLACLFFRLMSRTAL